MTQVFTADSPRGLIKHASGASGGGNIGGAGGEGVVSHSSAAFGWGRGDRQAWPAAFGWGGGGEAKGVVEMYRSYYRDL